MSDSNYVEESSLLLKVDTVNASDGEVAVAHGGAGLDGTAHGADNVVSAPAVADFKKLALTVKGPATGLLSVG